MPTLRYELHCGICQFTLWNSRLLDECLQREVTAEINLYSRHNLSTTSLNEF